jgi:TetR/AcrR family transcriptional repressor of nem operon
LAIALRRYIGGITLALAKAQEEGQVRSDLAPETLASLLVDTWEGAVIRMKIERSLEPLEQCLDRLLDGFFKP